jgi:carbohydrate-selective porin OprB
LLPKRISKSAEHPWFNFSVFIQTFATGARVIVGAHDILAKHTEQGLEFNTLLDVLPMLLLQPVVQYYANVGGGTQRAVVFGFRTKVEF